MNRRELLKGMTAAAVAGIFGHRLASEVPWFRRGSGLLMLDTEVWAIVNGVDQYGRPVEERFRYDPTQPYVTLRHIRLDRGRPTLHIQFHRTAPLPLAFAAVIR